MRPPRWHLRTLLLTVAGAALYMGMVRAFPPAFALSIVVAVLAASFYLSHRLVKCIEPGSEHGVGAYLSLTLVTFPMCLSLVLICLSVLEIITKLVLWASGRIHTAGL